VGFGLTSVEVNMRTGRERRSARKRRARQRSRRRTVIIVAILVVIPLVVAGLITATVMAGLQAIASVEQVVPELEAQSSVKLAQTTQIFAADNTLLAYLHAGENRTVISSKEIPDVLRHALVAIEDERFYQHNGVDLEGLLRALAVNIQAQGVEEGFSTITMQLVGNLYLDRGDISLDRKFNEMALAVQFERKYSKNEILDMYLNTVFFGANAWGVEAAAQTYFGKDPMELTLAEAALLAGLPQAPSNYTPTRYPEAALARRNLVLDKMYELGFITASEYKEAFETPIQLAPYSVYNKVQEPYVVAFVRKQLIQMFGEEQVFKGGLRVYTTINPEYQKLATEAIASTLDQKGDPAASLVTIEVNTGHIVAMMGGNDYDASQFNLASQGRRQPGSAFKTFVLTAAIEMGINPWTTYYVSQPVTLDYPGAPEPWKVTTYSGAAYGTSSIVQATLRSDNTVYAQMALDVGVERIADVAYRMGITTDLADASGALIPAMALGGLYRGVSPLEMASAYATLANGGKHIEPTIILKVTDTMGNILWEAHPKEVQAIPAGVAYDVTRILAMNIRSGTGTRADIGRPAAGKTGTASNWDDAWFCGYTPNLSTAVWMGDPKALVPMVNVHGQKVTGGSFPAIMWQKFMYEADRDYPEVEFAVPDVKVVYDPFFRSAFAVPPTSTSMITTTTSTSLPPSTTIGPTTSSSSPPSTNPPTTAPPTTAPPTTAPPTTAPPPPTDPPTTAAP
jgi:penicillin-binding protein 1A